jgi:hypothetical protein
MEFVRVGGAVLLAVVFATASLSKLRDFPGFLRSVPALAPVRPRWVAPLAVGVVAAELAVSVLVLVPGTATYGFVLAGALLLAFAGAIGVALRRGQRSSCRCFGVSSAPLHPGHVARNLMLVGLAAIGGSAPHHLPSMGGLAVAALAGAVGAVLVIAADDIAVVLVRSS